jgi:subtilisin family serine protease
MPGSAGVLTRGMLITRRWQVRTAAVAAAVVATGWTGLLAATPARADVVRSAEAWVINELNLSAAWQHTRGSGVTVAVIDSGVNPNVSDLAGSVTTGPDYSGVSTSPSNPNWGVHGTWMASLVVGHGHGPGDSDGIVGAAPGARVLSIRVITDAGDPNYAAYQAEPAAKGQSELAEAITYAVNHGAGVISMSLGYSTQSLTVRKALQDAYDHNVVVVASAGNSGDSAGAAGTGHAPYSYPANYPGVLGVAAVNQFGQVADFSTENLSVQVAAPGNNVPAQGNDGQYWYVSGTSPACALTAGVVALIKSEYPGLTDTQVISAITSTTTLSTRPRGGWDQQIGFGVVNAANALAAAGTMAAAAPPAAGLASSSHFGGGAAAVPAVPVAPRGLTVLVGYCLLAIMGLGLVAFAASRLVSLGGTDYPLAGNPGPASPLGPAGPAAAAWPAGPTRPEGPTWPVGPTWADGSAGPAGGAWPARPTWADGSAGPAAGAWPARPTWADGSAGPAAAPWPAGPAAAPAGPASDPYGQGPSANAATHPLRYAAPDRPGAGAEPARHGSSDGPQAEPLIASPAPWPWDHPPGQPRHSAPDSRGTGQPEQP